MNAQNSSPTPPPVPMEKEKVLKEDGRFLYYYSFSDAAPEKTGVPQKRPEDTDV